MSNKTVLAFIDWYRPGYKAGGTITAFGNFVDHLEEDFNFKIVTRNVDYLETEPYSNIVPNVWLKFGTTEIYYISEDQLSKHKIKTLITNTESDLVYVNGMFSLKFSILPILFSKNKSVIVNPHGMLSTQAFSVKPLKKKIFVGITNLISFYKNVTFHVANNDEAVMVKGKIKRFKVIKVANQFPRKLASSNISKGKKHVPVKFVNVARIAVEKGTLKMLTALKRIKAPLLLDIYGPIYDKSYWERCQAIIKDLPLNIEVNYKGVVASAEIPLILKDYDFFVLLSEGENFGHAILEGLASGCPVLISNQTPWKGLQEQQLGWDVDVRNNSSVQEAFNEAINMDEIKYEIWSTAAIEFSKQVANNPLLLEENKALFLNSDNKHFP